MRKKITHLLLYTVDFHYSELHVPHYTELVLEQGFLCVLMPSAATPPKAGHSPLTMASQKTNYHACTGTTCMQTTVLYVGLVKYTFTSTCT